jgi:hypothetical protein
VFPLSQVIGIRRNMPPASDADSRGAILTKKELEALAKQYLIMDDGLSSTNLIRRIQIAEGNFDCFATERVWKCNQSTCRWRRDCLVEAVEQI